MSYERECFACGERVKCRTNRRKIEGSYQVVVELICPKCGKQIGSVFEWATS